MNCSEANSGGCSLLIWFVMVPAALLTELIGLSSPAQLALPWSMPMDLVLSPVLSVAFGVGINGGIVGGLAVYLLSSKPRLASVSSAENAP
ncbi:hypothetical protein ABT392_05435 [Paucibacter sp. JuS9]|uniref:hypothetical protein n=1 Tax=Paucibacter sp. JuS9 TaxID=3228748 RepID=UPI0037566125